MSEFSQNIRAVTSAAREDMHHASLRDKAAFYATGLGLAAHQIGMEAALFAAGTNAYVAGHDSLGLAAPLAAGAATGLLSLSVEVGLTNGVSKGLTTFKSATEEVKERFIITDDSDEEAMDKLERGRSKHASAVEKFDTALVAIGVGSPATVLMDYTKHPEEPVSEHRKVGLRAAYGLAGLNAALGTAVGAGILVSEKLGTDAVYNGVETVADSPYTYATIAGLIAVRAVSAMRGHHKKRQAAIAKQKNTDEA